MNSSNERPDAEAQHVIDALRLAGEQADSVVELFRRGLQVLVRASDASFGSVFVRDPDDTGLLRLACASNWPQAAARYLGSLRLRVGRGPTGRAVAEGRPVEVANVFADPALNDWWQPARELGYHGLLSLPLRTHGSTPGAVTLYFTEARHLARDRRLVLEAGVDALARAWTELSDRSPPPSPSGQG
ncbi:MAG: GAF domain-containing protein [Longimicrobiales bacterium]